MSEQEARVLAAVKTNPLASQQELANQLNMSRESVAGHIMRLTHKGDILGKGYLFPKEKSIVVIGGCNVDITGRGHQNMLAHDSNPGSISHSAGGVGRNIAENLSRLNNNVTLVSALGTDQSGDWLLDHCRQAEINTDHIIRHPNMTTGTYLAVNDTHGMLQCAIADMTILDSINDQLLIQKQPLLRSSDLILIEANSHPSAIEWLSQQTDNMTIYADAVSATKAIRLLPLLPKLTALKVNREEATALLQAAKGLKVVKGQATEIEKMANNESQDINLAKQLLALGVKNVLLSLGEEGLLFMTQQHAYKQATYTVTPSSDTGAGDALFAAFIHGQLHAWDMTDTLPFASACAANTLACETANDPELNEETIKQWMSQHVNAQRVSQPTPLNFSLSTEVNQ